LPVLAAVLGIGIWAIYFRSSELVVSERLANDPGPRISGENIAKIRPGMTLVEAEAILGEQGWDETARSKGPAHRWTVKWATIRRERKHEGKVKNPDAKSWALWVSAEVMVKAVLDSENRLLTCDATALYEE